MKVTRKRKRKAEIPTASTGDIAFLLIVFFMSTTKFDVKEGVKITLNPVASEDTPQEQKTEELTEEFLTQIYITANGDLQINKLDPKSYTDEALDRLIQERIELRERENARLGFSNAETQMIFVLKTDLDAKYEDMVRVGDHLVSYKDRSLMSISTAI